MKHATQGRNTVVRKNSWIPFAELEGIDFAGEALSVVRTDGGGVQVVRPATSGGFAVIRCRGKLARIVKILPTADRATAYNRACS
jgi:hypothetical protein